MKRLMTINSVSLSPGGTSVNILAVGDGQPYSLSVNAVAYTTSMDTAAPEESV